MSTRQTIWFGTDEKGRDCHIYWELADRAPGQAALIFMSIEAGSAETTFRLPIEVAERIRGVLDPDSGWEVI